MKVIIAASISPKTGIIKKSRETFRGYLEAIPAGEIPGGLIKGNTAFLMIRLQIESGGLPPVLGLPSGRLKTQCVSAFAKGRGLVHENDIT